MFALNHKLTYDGDTFCIIRVFVSLYYIIFFMLTVVIWLIRYYTVAIIWINLG